MNRNKLKTYAPQARREFIEAVTARAALFGLTAKKIEPMTEQGDVVLVVGRAFPKAVGQKRKNLEARIQRQGFDQTMEAMAYTWFNRLVAIRFMELHGYLDHGYRVLSSLPVGEGQAESGVPEIVQHAEHVDLPGLNKQKVIELKLDGTKGEELYRLLLVAQCNALNKAMPFLFESIDDETELLVPDHLLHSDSLVRKLVEEIPEEDWREVEIIGWLYQFYISEKKDEVIGKVVKSEDIPAATQLFTPKWIVKYLVQNSLGRQWVATYPNSPLKGQMEYYIEPAEQTPEVQAKLAEITPTSLNPEELTLLDPACGSGHILVEAYDLLKSIYQERGYRAKDIPRLILEKNLFGLEIDDRAAQLAAFALTMKARADDRTIFSPRPSGEGPEVRAGVQPHVLSIQESKGLDAREITEALNQPILKEELPPSGELFEEIADEKTPLFSRKNLSVKGCVSLTDVAHLIDLFEHGKTFGSLISVSDVLAKTLPDIFRRIEDVTAHSGMFEKAVARSLLPVVQQAWLLARKYDVVVTNPPYLGNKSLNTDLRSLARKQYPDAKADLFSVFVQRIARLAKPTGYLGLMTPFTWMFIQSYEQFRRWMVTRMSITCLVQPELHAFFDSAYVSICAFTLHNFATAFRGTFINLSDFYGEDVQAPKTLEAIGHPECTWRFTSSANSFLRIPGCPIAYWASSQVIAAFDDSQPLSDIVTPRVGMITCNNNLFLRFWHEVDFNKMGLGFKNREEARQSGRKWFPYQKGGAFRKWYGNEDYVVNWGSDGYAIRNTRDESGKIPAHAFNEDYIFKPNANWSKITSGEFSARISGFGHLFDDAGSGVFGTEDEVCFVAGFLNSRVATNILRFLNPTLNVQAWNVGSLPLKRSLISCKQSIMDAVRRLRELAREDWNQYERSWKFQTHPWLGDSCRCNTAAGAHEKYDVHCSRVVGEMRILESQNNRCIIQNYGLEAELSAEVPIDHITAVQGDVPEDTGRLVSYAIGCMMGRYSLDEPGLVYAHSGNQGFDTSKYHKFPADEDGIIPLTDFDWFADDAACRFEAFLTTAWPAEHLEENLKFVAESLGPKNGEAARGTIRRYLAADFFKHHLSMYKKRPIYWLFSSGKQRGFQALVYLHRYNEGTLARMRTEYVIPLLGKMTARIKQLGDDIAATSSTAHVKKMEKEKATLTKQLAEVQAFDEKLRHYADQRISLDLDDGVKVNYGKFGDLLAEVKAVCGTSGEE